MKRLMILIVLCAALTYGCGMEQEAPDGMPFEETMQLAREHVVQSYQFTEYNGSDPLLVATHELDCENCYRFTYRFDVEGAPADTRQFEYSFDVKDGDIGNITVTEISGEYRRQME